MDDYARDFVDPNVEVEHIFLDSDSDDNFDNLVDDKNPVGSNSSDASYSVRPYSIPSSKPPSPSLNSSPPPEGVVAAGNVTDRACRSRRLLLQPLLSLCFPIAATSAAPSGSVSLFSSQPRPPLLCHRPPEASISPSAVPPPVSPPAAICPSTELSLGRLQPLFLPPALFASVRNWEGLRP